MEDLKVAVFTVLNQVFMTFLTNMLPNARARSLSFLISYCLHCLLRCPRITHLLPFCNMMMMHLSHSGNVEILGLHVLFVLAHEVLPHTFGMLTGELWKRVNALGTALHWRVPALKGGRVCSKWCKNWSRDILSVINCLGSGVMCRLACGRRLCAGCTRRSTLSIWQRTIAGDMTFPWSLGITLLVGLCLFSL